MASSATVVNECPLRIEQVKLLTSSTKHPEWRFSFAWLIKDNIYSCPNRWRWGKLGKKECSHESSRTISNSERCFVFVWLESEKRGLERAKR